MRSSNSSVARHPRPSHSRPRTIVSSVNSSRNFTRSSVREDAHRRLQEHRGAEENAATSIQVLDNAINRTPLPLQQRAPNAISSGSRYTTASAIKNHETDWSSSMFQSSMMNSITESKYASIRHGGGGGGGGGGLWASRRQSSVSTSSSIVSMSLVNIESNSISLPDTNSSLQQYGSGTPGTTFGGEEPSPPPQRAAGYPLSGKTVSSQRLMEEAIAPRPKPLTEAEYRVWWKQRTTITLRETPTIFLFHNQDVIVSAENPNEVKAVLKRHEELEKQQEIHRLDEGTKYQEKGSITFIAPKKSIHSEIRPPVKVHAVPLQVTTWMLKDEFSSLLADDDEEEGGRKGRKGGKNQDGEDKDDDDDDDNNNEDDEDDVGREVGDDDEEEVDDEDDDDDDDDGRHLHTNSNPAGYSRDLKEDMSFNGNLSSHPDFSGAGKTVGTIASTGDTVGKSGGRGTARSSGGKGSLSRANRKWLMADSLMSNLRIMERAVVQNYMEHLQLRYRGITMDPSCGRRHATAVAAAAAGGGGGGPSATSALRMNMGGGGNNANGSHTICAVDRAEDTLNPLWGGGGEADGEDHGGGGGGVHGGEAGGGEDGMGHLQAGAAAAPHSSLPQKATATAGTGPKRATAGAGGATTATGGGAGSLLHNDSSVNNTAPSAAAGKTGTVGRVGGVVTTSAPGGGGGLPAGVGATTEEDEYAKVPEVEMSPEMEILWRFRSPLTANRRVTCMAWNRKVTDVLVVGYSVVKSSTGPGGGNSGSSRRSSTASGGNNNSVSKNPNSSVETGVRGGRNQGKGAAAPSSRWGSREAGDAGGGGGRRGSASASGRSGNPRRSSRTGDRHQGGRKEDESPTDRRGLVCCWSLKNPLAPELALYLNTDASVSAVAFSYEHPSLLAVGNTDGGIVVYDIQRDMATPSIVPAVSAGQHTGAVWELKWVARGKERGEFLMSVSADGRVVQWAVGKCIEKVAPDLMHLTRQPGHPSESSCQIFVEGVAQADMAAGREGGASGGGNTNSSHNNGTGGGGEGRRRGGGGGGGESGAVRPKEAVLSRQCGGMCFDICPTDSAIYVVGTEDGSVCQCNKSQTESYDLDYVPHAELVYRIRWSPYSPLFFLTCSADWTTRVYRLDQAKPMLKLDSPNQDAVQDVSWSYTNALHFAAVTVQGNVEIWTLLDTIYPRWSIQYKDRRRLNAVLFAEQETPVIVVGDEEGDVCVFALTSYVFSRQELLDDEQERILEEAIRKQQS